MIKIATYPIVEKFDQYLSSDVKELVSYDKVEDVILSPCVMVAGADQEKLPSELKIQSKFEEGHMAAFAVLRYLKGMLLDYTSI
jgi:hypothetical protein